MQIQPTEIRLHFNNAEHVVLYLNEKCVGLFLLNRFEHRDHLMKRVDQAHKVLGRFSDLPGRLLALLKVHEDIDKYDDRKGKTTAAKQAIFLRGFIDGLGNKGNQEGPDETYFNGYGYGRNLREYMALCDTEIYGDTAGPPRLGDEVLTEIKPDRPEVVIADLREEVKHLEARLAKADRLRSLVRSILDDRKSPEEYMAIQKSYLGDTEDDRLITGVDTLATRMREVSARVKRYEA